MKKIVVVLLAVCLLFASSRYFSRAATSVPTVSWNLVPTAYMEQIGIFTDPVNHRGIYNYTANVTLFNTWYSNYYFKASAPRKFYLYGYGTTNPINQNVLVVMKDKIGSMAAPSIIEEYENYFINDYGSTYWNIFPLSDQAYFYFSIDNYMGPSVTFNGSLETY